MNTQIIQSEFVGPMFYTLHYLEVVHQVKDTCLFFRTLYISCKCVLNVNKHKFPNQYGVKM